jgi:hypothetical protein
MQGRRIFAQKCGFKVKDDTLEMEIKGGAT